MRTRSPNPFLKLDARGTITDVDYVALAKEEKRLEDALTEISAAVERAYQAWTKAVRNDWAPDAVAGAGKDYREACLARQVADQDLKNFREIRALVFPT